MSRASGRAPAADMAAPRKLSVKLETGCSSDGKAARVVEGWEGVELLVSNWTRMDDVRKVRLAKQAIAVR